jgi:hypothetical protein
MMMNPTSFFRGRRLVYLLWSLVAVNVLFAAKLTWRTSTAAVKLVLSERTLATCARVNVLRWQYDDVTAGEPITAFRSFAVHQKSHALALLIVAGAELRSDDALHLLVYVGDERGSAHVQREQHLAQAARGLVRSVLQRVRCVFQDDADVSFPSSFTIQKENFMASVSCPVPPSLVARMRVADAAVTRGATTAPVRVRLRLMLADAVGSDGLFSDELDLPFVYTPVCAHAVAACTAPLFGPQSQLVAWIAHHSILGVQHTHVYVRSRHIARALASLVDAGLVTTWLFPPHSPLHTMYSEQFLAAQHCIIENRQRATYVLLADADEYVAPMDGSHLLELAREVTTAAVKRPLSNALPSTSWLYDSISSEVHRAEAVNGAPRVGAISLPAVTFCANADAMLKTTAAAMTTARFRRRTRGMQPGNGKSVVRPSLVEWAGVHQPLLLRAPPLTTNDGSNETAVRIIATTLRLNHFRFSTCEAPKETIDAAPKRKNDRVTATTNIYVEKWTNRWANQQLSKGTFNDTSHLPLSKLVEAGMSEPDNVFARAHALLTAPL